MEKSLNIQKQTTTNTPNTLQTQIAVDVLRDIQSIYESSNKSNIIKELLITKYCKVESITSFRTYPFTLFDDDSLFYQEIEKEFKYLLLSNQEAFLFDSFLFSITYYLSIFYIDLIQKPDIYEKNKRFFKECMVTIINNLHFLPKQDAQEAIAIKFYKYLIGLMQQIQDKKYKKSVKVR